ncbi:MAG: hypothetical protein CL947_02495 [Epsilonproteobacteria bacterium]|nr:hypothetical protein [Campylobacterota bacterium]|tara:strand:+ start:102 stop:383 length:282 start_codon:yes stop_codon:yes gene_type:complete
MKKTKATYVKVDARNRVSLTKVLQDMPEMFKVYQDGDKIILEPIREIPESEKWLFEPENKHILKEIKKSLKQKATINRGSFAKYVDDDSEDDT